MQKVIIAGSRDFDDYDYLTQKVEHCMRHVSRFEVVSGGARGADQLGERYAKEQDLPLKIFPAEWDAHGKAAGYRRNREMAAYADAVIAFWDGYSRGTWHMIKFGMKQGLSVWIWRTDNPKQSTKQKPRLGFGL